MRVFVESDLLQRMAWLYSPCKKTQDPGSCCSWSWKVGSVLCWCPCWR